MEELFRTLTSDRLVLLFVLLVLSLIIYFILKRLMKLIVIALIMLTLFMGYMYYRGEKVPAPVKEMIEEGKKTKDTFDRINKAAEILKNGEEQGHSSKGSSRGSSSE